MTAVTPERGEGLNPEDEFFEVFESYRPAPSPATDEVVEAQQSVQADRECYGCINENNACPRCKPRLAHKNSERP